MKKQLQQHSQNFENQAPVESQSEEKITGFVFLNEQFHGCIAESLRILQSKNDSNRCTFDDEEDLLMACIIEEMTIEVHGDRGRSSPPLVCVYIYLGTEIHHVREGVILLCIRKSQVFLSSFTSTS
jgi:hypothetical protein